MSTATPPSSPGEHPHLGRLGIWVRETPSSDLARRVERLGYSALWIGRSPGGDLAVVDRILAATDRLAVATGIVNIWKDDAPSMARSYHRIAEAYPGRFLLGIGAGHAEATARYAKPYDALVDYLDRLDECECQQSTGFWLRSDRRSCAWPPSGPPERTPI